MKGGLQTIY